MLLSGPVIEDVWIHGIEGERSRGQRRELIRERHPCRAGIDALPDASLRRGDVKDAGVPRIDDERRDPSSGVGVAGPVFALDRARAEKGPGETGICSDRQGRLKAKRLLVRPSSGYSPELLGRHVLIDLVVEFL